MAAVWQCTGSITDSHGKKSPVSFFLIGSLTAAQAATAAKNILETTTALSRGAMDDVKLAYKPDTSMWTLPAVIDPQSDRRYKGRFLFSTADGFVSRVSIPALDPDVESDNSEDLNRETGEPAKLFETAFLTEDTVDERGEPLTSLLRAYGVHGQ